MHEERIFLKTLFLRNRNPELLIESINLTSLAIIVYLAAVARLLGARHDRKLLICALGEYLFT